jgi:AraC family transcriptional regulator
MDNLFTPLKLGALHLKHRVVMAPLTRLRAGVPGRAPHVLAPIYYGQCASEGGLLISEATDIAPSAIGYQGAPGVYSRDQRAGWRRVTEEVHRKGGLIVSQIWHTGRVSHSSLQPDGCLPGAPSAIPPLGQYMIAGGVNRALRNTKGPHGRRYRRDHRGLREGGDRCACRQLRRCREPWRERLSHRPIPPDGNEPARRPLRRRDREPRAVPARSDGRRRRGCGRGAGGRSVAAAVASPLLHTTTDMHQRATLSTSWDYKLAADRVIQTDCICSSKRRRTMTDTIASLNAHKHLPAKMTACSWQAGWRSLLLRSYEDAPHVEEFTTPASPDHLVVLVVGGSCELEGRYRGAWRKAEHRIGSIGMTAPGEEVTLRWHGTEKHNTLQLHIPEATLRTAYDEFSGRGTLRAAMPNTIAHYDPLIERTILSLHEAMSQGTPDLYAESAAHFLTAHLLIRHANASPPRRPLKEELRIRRVDDFLRENLATSISLDDVADIAGVSRFHLLRLFKHAHGETPFRRLTRMRIETAKERLLSSDRTITEIAFACGYGNSAHFATAFRRWVGVSPAQYRQQNR